MITIFAFIIVVFGSLNWLSIGMFQYDLVAGLFGYQGSIFSRMIYIIIGISCCWLTYSVIKNKGHLNPKKLKHDERVLYNKQAKQEQVLREINNQENSYETLNEQNNTAQNNQNYNNQSNENQNDLSKSFNNNTQNRNHDNIKNDAF